MASIAIIRFSCNQDSNVSACEMEHNFFDLAGWHPCGPACRLILPWQIVIQKDCSFHLGMIFWGGNVQWPPLTGWKGSIETRPGTRLTTKPEAGFEEVAGLGTRSRLYRCSLSPDGAGSGHEHTGACAACDSRLGKNYRSPCAF